MTGTADSGHGPIRTYGRRSGRITRGQKRALERWSAKFLIPFSGGRLIDRDGFVEHRPVVLDLGCGMCDSIIEMARQRPECHFLGIDVYEPGIARGCALAAEAGLDNIRLVRHDMLDVLGKGIRPDSIDDVYVLFPDPWPKQRHHKRRLVQSPFLALVHRVLRPGGRCVLATDWAEYAEHIQLVFSQCREFTADSDVGSEIVAITKFNRRGQAQGRAISQFCYKAV